MEIIKWRFKENQYHIKFYIKNGIGKNFTLHNNINGADNFLKDNELYKILIADIEAIFVDKHL